MSAPDPHPTAPTRRRRRALVVGVAAAAVLASLITVIVGSGPKASPSPQTLPSSFDRDVASSTALAELQGALERDDREAFVGHWDASSQAQDRAAVLFDNLSGLRAGVDFDVFMAFGPSDPQRDAFGGRAWEAQVDVGWWLRGIGLATADASVDVLFRWDGESTKVLDITAGDIGREPIWLNDTLVVVADAHTLAAAPDQAAAQDLSDLLHASRRDVRRVIGVASGTVLAYLPSDAGAYESLLNGVPHEFDSLAAAVTTVDGTYGDSMRMIAINPEPWQEMTDEGRQIVVTHEVTHVAVDVSSAAPAWLEEGLADYVATQSGGLGVDIVTRPALDYVREHGVPRRLPSEDDFGYAADRIEVSYELSHLAVRMLVERYGARRVAEMYGDVVSGRQSLDAAIQMSLSISLPELTRQWRTEVEELADAP